jgi:PEP-CTERM motif
MERVGIPPNIAAAIRRSQDARAAIRSRRRRRSAAIGALCLAGAVPVSLTFADFNTSDMVQAAVTKAQSLVDMLNKRSPGERTAAQLTKTKHMQRALAKVQPLVRKPVVPPITMPLTPMQVELASIVMPAPSLVSPPLGQIDIGPPPTLGAIVSPPGGGAIVAPPGGGPPATNPTEPRPPVIETPPPPVPEPATWLTMLLGFGLLGWRVRSIEARPQLLAA